MWLGKVSALALVAALALWFLGRGNLASIAWSHRILDGTRSPAFADVVLQDHVGEGGEAGKAALEGGGGVSPFSFEPWRQKAMYALEEGRDAEAASDLGRAWAQADATNRRMMYESLIVYGQTEAAAGRDALARGAYELLIEQAPEQSMAYVRLGELQRSGGDYPAAIATFKRAVAADDLGDNAHIEKARAYQWLGALYGAVGDKAASVEAYKSATKEDPANAGWYWTWNAYMALGQEAAARNARDEAAQWFRQAAASAVTPEQQAEANGQLEKIK